MPSCQSHTSNDVQLSDWSDSHLYNNDATRSEHIGHMIDHMIDQLFQLPENKHDKITRLLKKYL